jgi:hypothetical protein
MHMQQHSAGAYAPRLRLLRYLVISDTVQFFWKFAIDVQCNRLTGQRRETPGPYPGRWRIDPETRARAAKVEKVAKAANAPPVAGHLR